MEFKRVPAVDKCFQILEFFGKIKEPMGITTISNELGLNKSTVFNIVHTLSDLGVLETNNSKFKFGTKLYVLGKAAEQGSDLIRNIHPYLEEISRKTSLSSFLGMRSGHRTVIIDKADSLHDLKISSEVGIKIPLVAGAHGKALLSLLADHEVNEILSSQELKKYTHFSTMDKKKYREDVIRVRKEGFAYEDEEYIEGIRALAIPLHLKREDLQCAIWVAGLKSQLKEESLGAYIGFLKETIDKIESKF